MGINIENPWHQLPTCPPFELPADAEPIRAFNARAKPQLHLHLELLPEPYLGNPIAPVVLLNLNPGYSPEDLRHHLNPTFIQRSRENLLHSPSQYPFFLVDPAITAPGNKWWSRKLGALIRQFGLEFVAQHVLCVEYLPYHSRRFGHQKLRLPSQMYSFLLVREGMKRHATFVIMRSKRFWTETIPELNGYDRICEIRSVQNPCISPANCPDGFDTICEAFDQAAFSSGTAEARLSIANGQMRFFSSAPEGGWGFDLANSFRLRFGIEIVFTSCFVNRARDTFQAGFNAAIREHIDGIWGAGSLAAVEGQVQIRRKKAYDARASQLPSLTPAELPKLD